MKTNKTWKVAVLNGDGTGPDIMKATLPVIEAVKKKFSLNIELTHGEAGFNCIEKEGTNLPEKTVELLKSSDCILKGPMTTPEGSGSEQSAAVKIRKMFDLYADVRPSKTLPNVPSIKPGIDLVIVRENTEGMYSGLDFRVNADTAIGMRVITRTACEHISRFAFELSKGRKKHLTHVHKANILKASDGLFKEVVAEIAKEYPEVRVDDAHVDAMTQWLIKNPQDYDVIVTENLFGDIISDEAAMVVGGVGVGPSANIGDKYAMFEPIHGSAPKYAGQDKVNPIGTILSFKMMLDWMGYKDAAQAVYNAVESILKEGKTLTYDLGGHSKCSEVGIAIAKMI